MLNKVVTYAKDIDQQIADGQWEEIQKLLKKLIDYHTAQLLPHYQKMDNYFNAETEILNRKRDDASQPNNKLVNDYAGYITVVGAGYFMGSPVKYTANEEFKDAMEEIQTILDNNDEPAHNMYLALDAAAKGHSYELVYTNEESKVEFSDLDPKEVIMVYDDKIKESPLFAVRYYKSSDIMAEDEKTLHVEIYSKLHVVSLELNDSKIKPESIVVDDNDFGEVQVIEYMNNKYRRGDFQNVMSLIDAYDKTSSDEMNDIDYFSDAYLLLKNLSGTTDDDIDDMKKNRIIYIENDGDAKFLVKDGGDQRIENMKGTLNENIHKFSHTPDLRDENFANNVSGVAMKFKLWGLEQKTTLKESSFRKALMRRLKLITRIMNAKKSEGQAAFGYTYIQPTFSRSLPTNWDELLKMIQGLNGVVSTRKLLAYIPDVDDPDYELEQLKKERDDMGFQIDPYQVSDFSVEEPEEEAKAGE